MFNNTLYPNAKYIKNLIIGFSGMNNNKRMLLEIIK